MESKRERFIRLAEARTNKILNMVKLLGNLSNTSSYEYTEEDVNLIYDKIFEELKASRARFGSNIRRNDEPFTLGTEGLISLEGRDFGLKMVKGEKN